MSWHSRTIDKLDSRLNFLKNTVRINTNHGQQAGSDIEIYINSNGRKINIEV
jgi:hypothetical protein